MKQCLQTRAILVGLKPMMSEILSKILKVANNALYFADSSDYGEALYEICVLVSKDTTYSASSYIEEDQEISNKSAESDMVGTIDLGANTKRLATCVNGCLDIPDEDLDKFFKWARNMWFRQERLLKEEREKLAKMNDKERAEYEARREATLDYNLRSLRRAANVESLQQ